MITSVLISVLKFERGVLIEVCGELLDGVLFVSVGNMAVDFRRYVYVAMPHEAACVQQGYALPRQYRTKCMTEGMYSAPFLYSKPIAQTLECLQEVTVFSIYTC